MEKNWLANGGAYWLIFSSWFIAAGATYALAHSLGRATRSENDGCLLGLGNIVLSFVGGGIGLLAGKFPYFVLTSLVGAFALPGLATLIWLRRRR